jgi:hypothetical protein
VAAVGCALAIAPLPARPQSADSASLRFAAAGTRVTIAVEGDRARVRAELVPADSARDAPAVFSYLAQECAPIDSLRVTRGSEVLALSETEAGPWRRVTAPAPSSPSQGTHLVEYVVRLLGGEPKIPIVLPADPLVRGVAHDPGALVTLTFRTGSGRVVLPRMERAPDAPAWHGRYLALPSFVRVAGVGADGSCAAPATSGDSGGLPARFYTFVAVLVLWVPLYLWWVSRDPEPRPAADA